MVDELPDAFLAAIVVERIGRLLGVDQIVLGVVVGHLAHAADDLAGDGIEARETAWLEFMVALSVAPA